MIDYITCGWRSRLFRVLGLCLIMFSLSILPLCASQPNQADHPGLISGELPAKMVPALPCQDCDPPPPPPGVPADILLQNTLIRIGVSTKYGGSIDDFEFLGGGDGNLVAGGDSGLLLQTAFRHIGNNFPSHDDTGLTGNYEWWENNNSYAPSCHGSQLFTWNPTQGGTFSQCDLYQGSNYFDSLITFADMQEHLPVHQSPNDGASPVSYTIQFRPWIPYDLVYQADPTTRYRPTVWEDATVSLVSSTGGVAVAKHQARYRLAKWKSDGTEKMGFTTTAIAEDQVFYATSALPRVYVYNPDVTTDCFGMKEITSTLCSHGDSTCSSNFGWRTTMGAAKWTPYVLLSNAAQTTWLLIYNTQDTANYIQARRRLIDKGDPAHGCPGPVVTFVTAFYSGVLSTDNWTSPLTTYYILGTSYGNVMNTLATLSPGGIYPKHNGSGNCGGCTTFPCPY